MIYKLETQNKNAEKLQRKFEEENIPSFIRDYFYNKESQLSAINYWLAVKDLLKYLMENKIINKQLFSEITPQDFALVKPVHINTYLNNKEKISLLSPATLKTRKNILKSFWEYLVDEDECPVKKNIIKKVAYKGISSSSSLLIRKLPTEEQLQQMEKKINQKNDGFVRIRNLAVFNLLKGSGIREGGLAGLDLSDLYLDEEMPYIKVLPKGKFREIEKRTVYLTGKAVIYLREWLEVRNLLEVKNTEAVFLNKNGKRLNEKNIQDIFTNYGNGITPHMIRHWYATVLANIGNVAFAQQQLGHASQDTTINSYVLGSYGMKDILANM